MDEGKKKGKWVYVEYPYFIPTNADYYECSECKEITLISHNERITVCPCCGSENEYKENNK